MLLCIFIAAGSVITLLITLSIRKDDMHDRTWKKDVKGCFNVIFWVGLLTCFLFVLTATFIDNAYSNWDKGERVYNSPLYSLKGMSKISGEFFFLGSGRINEKDYYSCFGKNQYGGFNKLNFPVGKSTIYELEDPNKIPYSNIITYRLKMPSWVGLNFGSRARYHYELYVPKGTIIQEFKAE